LADTIIDAERLGDSAVGLYGGTRVAVKFLDETLEFAGQA